jgi:hypothetical protein
LDRGELGADIDICWGVTDFHGFSLWSLRVR